MIMTKESRSLVEGILALSPEKLSIYFSKLDPEALAYVELLLDKYEREEL